MIAEAEEEAAEAAMEVVVVIGSTVVAAAAPFSSCRRACAHDTNNANVWNGEPEMPLLFLAFSS